MLITALRTLRTRWVTFVGSFVALASGVALLTVTGLALASSLDAPHRAPERFAAAPVVVRGQDTLRVATPIGDRTQPLAGPRPVPAPVVARLVRLGEVVEDRAFPVRADGGRAPGALVGHPWSTAAFAPYALDAGRAPRTADEVVVTGDWAAPGERVRTDRGTLRVVGTVPGLGFEDAVFFTDARAAELAPLGVQMAVDAEVDAVRDAVRGTPGVHVLTGDDRRYADADPDRDEEALTAMNALFGTAGGVTAFVSVFVVASTFAFAVVQRRREFGLLRTAGATPGQLRRMVLAEAAGIGVLASAAGCALGSYAAPYLVGRLVDAGLAPAWFRVGGHVWPYHVAFWTGLLVTLCGVVAASWRAGRTAPVEALREAAAETRAMTPGRLVLGVGLLLTALVTLGVTLATDPGDLLHRKTYVVRPMLLITATALLAPVAIRLLTRALAWIPGVTALLIRENAATAARRTAAAAAPTLVTVALTGSLLGATATLDEARATETRARTTADYVVTGAGLDERTAARLREVPGTKTVSPSASTTVYVLEEGVALLRSEARAVTNPAALTGLPLSAGKASDLDDDSIIVNEEWERHTVGDKVDVWLEDGTRRALRIAAVMPTGTGDNGAYITRANAPEAPLDRIEVTVTGTALHKAWNRTGTKLLPRTAWLATTHPTTNRTTTLGLRLILGIALLYTALFLVNTALTAASDRTRDLGLLHLTGATKLQILRLAAAESLAITTMGALLGLLTAALNLAGMTAALHLLSAPTPVALPWATLAATATACAALAAAASITPIALSLRHRTPRSRTRPWPHA